MAGTDAAAVVTATDAPAPPAEAARCGVCGAALAGRYCQNCGQPSPAARRTLRVVLAGQYGRLGHTLVNILARPGELAREVDTGRDHLSLRPMTLMFHLAAFFFLAATFTGFGVDAILRADPSGEFRSELARHAAAAAVDPALYGERLEHRFEAIYTLFVPIVALSYGVTMGLLHWRRKPWIVPLVAGIQYLCFVYLFLALLLTLARRAGVDPYGFWPLQVASASIGAFYAAAAQRRIYDERWPTAAAKGVVVVAVGIVVHNFMLVAALGVALAVT